MQWRVWALLEIKLTYGSRSRVMHQSHSDKHCQTSTHAMDSENHHIFIVLAYVFVIYFRNVKQLTFNSDSVRQPYHVSIQNCVHIVLDTKILNLPFCCKQKLINGEEPKQRSGIRFLLVPVLNMCIACRWFCPARCAFRYHIIILITSKYFMLQASEVRFAYEFMEW